MTSNPDVPPFIGYVETTVNALRLIHAARQGVIPRITRRLNDSERRTMIKSGAVFVFCVQESQIKRWTGKSLATYRWNLEFVFKCFSGHRRWAFVVPISHCGQLSGMTRNSLGLFILLNSNKIQVYREINERTSSRGHKKPYPHDDSPTRSLTGKSSPDQVSLGYRSNTGSDQGTFKAGGLIKKVNQPCLH